MCSARGSHPALLLLSTGPLFAKGTLLFYPQPLRQRTGAIVRMAASATGGRGKRNNGGDCARERDAPVEVETAVVKTVFFKSGLSEAS
jgi:hypothetical protein